MTNTNEVPLTDGIGDVFGRVLAVVSDELADLVDAPAWSLDDARLDRRLAEALSVRAAVDQVIGELVGEMDDRHLATQVGASSTRAHLVGAHRLSRAEAARVTTAARQLHGGGRSAVTEPIRRAQASGGVSGEQAVTIATAINRLDAGMPIERIQAAQADLIEYAATLLYDQLQQVANHVVEVVDPEHADALLEAQLLRQERAALAGCELTMSIHSDGTSHGRFSNLPAVPTAMLKKALEALAAPRRLTTDETLTTPLLDHRVETSPEEVPYASRMGRAFAALIEHLPVDGYPTGGSTNATVVATIGSGKASAPRPSTPAPRSRSPRRVGSHATPGCCRWCWPETPRCSTSVSPGGSSTATSDSPSPIVTAAACFPAASVHQPGARHTTSSPGPAAAPRTCRTVPCCAVSTTT